MQLVNGVPRGGDTKNQNFLTTAPRFQADSPQREPQPGPGQYQVEHGHTWFKRSYNMNFSEM